jgi:hypothetical protein
VYHFSKRHMMSVHLTFCFTGLHHSCH